MVSFDTKTWPGEPRTGVCELLASRIVAIPGPRTGEIVTSTQRMRAAARRRSAGFVAPAGVRLSNDDRTLGRRVSRRSCWRVSPALLRCWSASLSSDPGDAKHLDDDDRRRSWEIATATSDGRSEFFSELERRGYEPLLQNATGSVRFDLARGDDIDHWLVAMKSGHVTVSRAAIGADCLVRADKALFDGIARGEVNATAALLRGELTAVGDLELLMVVQRLFPGPPGSQRGERSPLGRDDG